MRMLQILVDRNAIERIFINTDFLQTNFYTPSPTPSTYSPTPHSFLHKALHLFHENASKVLA